MAATARINVVLVTGVVLLGALMGCTTAAPPSPTPVPTSTPSVASPTPTPLSPAEQDLKNAKDAVVKMWAVVDTLTNNPTSTSIEELNRVAEGAALEELQNMLMGYRAQGWTGSGSTVVRDATAASAGTDSKGRATWRVEACVDRSGTTLVDTRGKSMQVPPFRIAHRWTVIERGGSPYVSGHEAT